MNGDYILLDKEVLAVEPLLQMSPILATCFAYSSSALIALQKLIKSSMPSAQKARSVKCYSTERMILTIILVYIGKINGLFLAHPINIGDYQLRPAWKAVPMFYLVSPFLCRTTQRNPNDLGLSHRANDIPLI